MKNLYNTKRIKSFRQGQTVYTVAALGNVSYLRSYRVAGRFTTKGPCTSGTIPAINFNIFGKKWLNQDLFALDLNIIENGYNDHRLFTSRRKAESYLKLCLADIVDGFIYKDEDDLWFEEGECVFEDNDHDDFIDYLPGGRLYEK